MKTRRCSFVLLVLGLLASPPAAHDAENARPDRPDLARFACRFEKRGDGGETKDRFELRGSPDSLQLFLSFSDWSGKATLERHEVLWPATIELHVVGPRDTITWIELTTDGGLSFNVYISGRKSVDYYDLHGQRCHDVHGSAFRFETEPLGDGVRLRVIPPPSARDNKQWGVEWFSTSW